MNEPVFTNIVTASAWSTRKLSRNGVRGDENVSEVRRKLNSPTGLGSQGAVVWLPRLVVEGERGWPVGLEPVRHLWTGGEIYNHGSYTEVLAPRAA